MPSLPPVEETFEASVGPYVAGLDAMVAAAERARDMNLELLASIDLVNEAMTGEAARAATSAAANQAAASAAGDAARATAGLGAADAVAAKAAADAAKSEYLLAMAERMRARSADEATAATAGGTLALGRFGLTWNTLHWIIAGGAELLAVTIPAAIAAASGAFVLYQGVVEQVGVRTRALYGATESTAAMLHKTTGDVLGLGHAFQTAQDAANPVAYELLGSYVNAAKSHMVDLAGAGLQVAQALGELSARINVDLINNGGRLTSLLSNMVPDLIQLGQVFGNLGHAVLNFASDMPGLAELLLRVADAVSRVILWVSQLPAPLIMAFMVFEELSRWGGGLVGVFGRLGLATSELGGSFFSVERFGGILSNVLKAIPMLIATVISNVGSLVTGFGRFGGAAGRAGGAMRNFGADMTDAIVAVPVWQAALAALAVGGFIFLADKALTARTATQQFTDSLQKAAEAAKNVNIIGTIAGNMAQLYNAETQAAAGAGKLGQNWTEAGISMHTGVEPVSNLTIKMNALSAGMTQQERDLRNVTQGAQYLGKTYGTDLTASLALADVAGVKLVKGITGQGQAAQIARQQIANLVAGYKAMGQTGGILNNDMNALAIQAGLQITKVQQLNQAWDQFMQNATGLTSSFAGLVTDIGQINNAITTAGTRFRIFGGHAVSSTDAAARSLRSFSGVGAQVWQNYDQALQQAQQFTDSLRTAAAYGAVSQKAFAQQVAYTAQQLLPYAKYSKTATEELSALVQEAGGPATSNYKTLKAWIDKNSESAAKFNKQMMNETGQLSDVSKAASDFASTLDSQVASALNDAKIASANLTTAAGNLNTAWQRAHSTVSGPVISSFSGLVTSLFKVYGNTKTAMGIADAYARSLGMNQTQVKILNQDIQGLIKQLDSIPNINRSVTITTNYVGPTATGGGGQAHVRTPGGNAAGAEYAARGVALVGEQGPELVRFAGGEQVTPSWQTAPILRGGGGGEGTLNLAAQVNVNVAGSRLQSKIVQQSLIYTRRNPTNNLSLRVR